jgi:hypothetical protein
MVEAVSGQGTTRAKCTPKDSQLFSRLCPNFFGSTRETAGVFGLFRRMQRFKNPSPPPIDRQCKISICEVLISVTLSSRGEVAERLKAAVC